MEGYIQDILGNLIMFFGMWTAAFRMPKRSLFWVRLAGCFAVFCGIRYLVFQQGIPLIHGNYVDYVRMAAFSLIIAMPSASSVSADGEVLPSMRRQQIHASKRPSLRRCTT